jgi:hypothetical protein
MFVISEKILVSTSSTDIEDDGVSCLRFHSKLGTFI